MTNAFQHFGVIGAGAWGTALATAMRRAGRDVTLWAHRAQVADAITREGKNTVYLPGITLDPTIKASGDLTALSQCQALIFATPAQHLRETAAQLKGVITPGTPIIITAKGIEQGSCLLLSEVLAETLPEHPRAILSGPSFAAEVARALPTALTFAMGDARLGEALVQAMATPVFRLYRSDDVIGAQIGGAIKNVLAVACGILAGRTMGENARAALITRGLTEMMRLGTVLGARRETLMGLSGLGDLILTCGSPQSRNMSLGFALGQGQKLADILAARASVTEGVTTAAAARLLAQRHGVDMPITVAVDEILSHDAAIEPMIERMLARPLRSEDAY